MPDQDSVEDDNVKEEEQEEKPAKKRSPLKKKGSRLGLASPKANSSRKEEAPKNYKTSINDRLDKAVNNATIEKSRSPDLVPLSQEFESLRKQLRTLIAVTKKYNEAYVQVETARAEMLGEMGKLSENTPLYDNIAKPKNEESLAFVNKSAAKDAKQNAIEFNKEVVEYVHEWESIVTSRVDGDLKDVKKLGNDRSHYQGKVDKLRQEVNKLETLGKPVGEPKLEKLKRNEMKLKEAFDTHELAAGKTCVLIEEVVHSGWKDLYPLVKATMNWEMERVSGEQEVFGHLPNVLDRVNYAYKTNKKK